MTSQRSIFLGEVRLAGGPLAGATLNELGVQLSGNTVKIPKGDGDDWDPGPDLEKARQEAEEKRRAEEEERRRQEEWEAHLKLLEERKKDPRWKKYYDDLDQYSADLRELRRIRDSCVEKARTAHATRDKEIGDDLDTCLFFGVAGAGVTGAFAGGSTPAGPWGALGGAVVGGGLAVLYCYQAAAKKRADSLLQLAAEEKACNDAFEEASKKLKAPQPPG